jgi:hypothetical protein
MGIFDFTTKLLPLLLKVRRKLSYRNGYYELCRSFDKSRCILYSDLTASLVEHNNVLQPGKMKKCFSVLGLHKDESISEKIRQ